MTRIRENQMDGHAANAAQRHVTRHRGSRVLPTHGNTIAPYSSRGHGDIIQAGV